MGIEATRRAFLQGLAAAGAPIKERPTHRRHTGGAIVYRGPMTIPADVAAAVAVDPGLYKARGAKLRSRYAQRERNGVGSAAVYVFACAIPAHRGMVGEIVLSEGHYGVHCWSAADPNNYDEPLVIAARKQARLPPPPVPADLPRPTLRPEPIMPPLDASNIPAWRNL